MYALQRGGKQEAEESWLYQGRLIISVFFLGGFYGPHRTARGVAEVGMCAVSGSKMFRIWNFSGGKKAAGNGKMSTLRATFRQRSKK